MIKISVIIVTWNSSHLIEDVLNAVTAQTLKPTRVLLVDNGSDDVELLAKVIDKFPSYELLRLPENRGFATANNIGISFCQKFDFIALLNPDAFPDPVWLETLVAAAQLYPAVAAFGSRLLDYKDPDLLDGAGDYLTITGKPGRRGHGLSANKRFVDGEEVFSPCAAAALYRYSALAEVGGFDERFFCYIEDVDLAFRLLLAGYGSRYVPESVVSHMGSALTGRRSDFSIYFGHRNLVWNFVKNMPDVLFWSLLPLHIMLNMVTMAYFIFRGQGSAILRAKIDAIKGLPEIWRSRREIQAGRSASVGEIWRALDKRLWP